MTTHFYLYNYTCKDNAYECISDIYVHLYLQSDFIVYTHFSISLLYYLFKKENKHKMNLNSITENFHSSFPYSYGETKNGTLLDNKMQC